MATASNLADWWDKQHRDYHKLFEDFVDENPEWWAVGISTLATIPTGLGAGLVDVLRLGKGMSEGGIKGVGTDVLRLIAVAGPIGRSLRIVAKGGQAILARLVVNDSGQICTWMSAAKALRHVGARLFVSVDDLARAEGFTTSNLPTRWADQLIPVLHRFGARVTRLQQPQSLNDVRNAAQASDGVILFAVKWTLNSGQKAYHTLYAFRDFFGKVKFADRSNVVVSTLKELERLRPVYSGIGAASVHSSGNFGLMVQVRGAQMLIPKGSGLAALVMPVTKLFVQNEDVVDPEVVKAAFVAKKKHAGRRRWRKRSTLPPVKHLKGVQARLNNLGFDCGVEYGIFGIKSKEAVIVFQKKYGLYQDGIPGPKTQKKLQLIHGS